MLLGGVMTKTVIAGLNRKFSVIVISFGLTFSLSGCTDDELALAGGIIAGVAAVAVVANAANESSHPELSSSDGESLEQDSIYSSSFQSETTSLYKSDEWDSNSTNDKKQNKQTPEISKISTHHDIEAIDEEYKTIRTTYVRQDTNVLSEQLAELSAGERIVVLGKVRGTEWLLIGRDGQQLGYVVDTALRPIQEEVVSRPTVDATIPSGSLKDIGDYYAIVIGNNSYKWLASLKSAVSDARAVSKILKEEYGFKVETLINSSRAQILDAIDRYRKKLTDNDNLLIYYAGHGVLDDQSDRGYWLPIDAREKSRSSWLSNSDISDALRAIEAHHVIVVADSCYSGTLTRSAQRGILIERRTPSYVKKMLKFKSRTVLSSGSLEPVSDSGGGQHSVFAKAFLDALDRNTAIMEGTKLFTFVREQVRLNSNQTPQYQNIRLAGHEVGGDFLFIKSK
jgi:uncharacterized caspase-like protein